MNIKFFNANNVNSIKKLEIVLNKRKLKQQNNSKVVKNLILNVKKYGDNALIKYEKKFSKVKTSSKKIKFTNILFV